MRRRPILSGLVLGLALSLTTEVIAEAQAQPMGMPDPRRMSGIPRPDPQVPPGEVTVRCLLGGFAEPAVGVEVTLEVQDEKGTPMAPRIAVTDGQGRATFADLESAFGGKAVASANLDGRPIRSQPIDLLGSMGTRVLLVKGANAAQSQASAPSPHGSASVEGSPHGAPGATGDVPLPGQPFTIEGHPPGTLVVGTLDLREGGKALAVEVQLTITPPEGKGDPQTLAETSDAQGRAIFRGLVAPKVPEGSFLQVAARIDPEGEPQKSVSFQLSAPAMAVYLAEGFEAAGHAAVGSRPTGPSQLPGPRLASDLGPDVVRVRVVDGSDAPVSGQLVEVWKKDIIHDDERFVARTDESGVALVKGVTVQGNAAYFVGVQYDGAPYQTAFFEMSGRSGVEVDLRVFPVTNDVANVRSIVQFQLLPRENDHVQVFQFLQVMVTGDHAYWPVGGLDVKGAEGTKGLKVHPRASAWLEEKEGAPFARLSGPLTPGAMVDLSVVYLLEHDGDLAMSWASPFPVTDAAIVIPKEFELTEPDVSPQPIAEGQGHEEVNVFRLGERPPGSTVEFTVSGLPTRPRAFRWVGMGTLGVLSLGLLAGLLRPRKTRVERLQAQRDRLLSKVGEASGVDRERLVRALDRIYRELDARQTRGP